MSGRILVVDDQPANVRVLEAKLQAEYFDVVTASSGQEAIEVATVEQPDVILLDVMMPGMDGYEACRLLKDARATRHIPVIMVTALDQREDRIRGLECGADDFLTKPIDDVTLFARVRSLLRLKAVLDELRYRDQDGDLTAVVPDLDLSESDVTALVVAQSGETAARYAKLLPARVHAVSESDPAIAVKLAADADVLVVDLSSKDFDGLRLCARVRSNATTRQVPIITIVPPDDIKTAVRALDIGVNDFIHRPVDAGEFNARLQTQLRRKRYADRLRTRLDQSLEMAVTDPLTGLHNRRYIASRLRQALESVRVGGAPVSLVLIDIDHFKQVNDTHGHEAGDAVLQAFAGRMGETLRALDIAARYGGEEFLVLMPGAGLAEAEIGAERLRQLIEATPFKIGRGVELSITASFGLAQASRGESVESLLRRADEALYAAKAAGRNRIQAASSDAA